MEDDITVSREYFLALLRRAEYVEKGNLKNTVLVSCDEYARLQQGCVEYKALKTALVKAGTPMDSIELLINANIETPEPQQADEYLPEFKTPRSENSVKRLWNRAPLLPPGLMQKKSWRRDESEPTTPTTFDSESTDEELENSHNSKVCHKDRSVVLTGTTKYTTLADICKAIRGGAILNMYRKEHDQTFHIAFLEPAAAEDFIRHTKKDGLYVKGKRIDVSWDERQHHMSNGLAHGIRYSGATRNLVIRFATPGVTAEIIREDLEHIHLLEVVSLSCNDGHAWISLNSVQHAMTAKNCLRSRFRYKGSLIQYWPDECAQPWQVMHKPVVQSWKPKHHPNVSTVSVNRFDGLLECLSDQTSSESGSDA